MEIKTFTNFWSSDMKLYAFRDMALPFPISLRVAGVFLGVGIPYWLLLWLLNLPFAAPWHMVWIGVPAGIAFLASGNFFEKKTLLQYVTSRISHFMEEKRYKGLQKDLNSYGKDKPAVINIILPLNKKDRVKKYKADRVLE